jgi:hypothetical protein
MKRRRGSWILPAPELEGRRPPPSSCHNRGVGERPGGRGVGTSLDLAAASSARCPAQRGRWKGEGGAARQCGSPVAARLASPRKEERRGGVTGDGRGGMTGEGDGREQGKGPRRPPPCPRAPLATGEGGKGARRLEREPTPLTCANTRWTPRWRCYVGKKKCSSGALDLWCTTQLD